MTQTIVHIAIFCAFLVVAVVGIFFLLKQRFGVTWTWRPAWPSPKATAPAAHPAPAHPPAAGAHGAHAAHHGDHHVKHNPVASALGTVLMAALALLIILRVVSWCYREIARTAQPAQPSIVASAPVPAVESRVCSAIALGVLAVNVPHSKKDEWSEGKEVPNSCHLVFADDKVTDDRAQCSYHKSPWEPCTIGSMGAVDRFRLQSDRDDEVIHYFFVQG